MNHYRAAQRELDKRWDYVQGNRRTGTYPIGYCAGWKELGDYSNLEGLGIADEVARDIEDKRPLKDKFHHDGHATEEEACECYRQFLLDTSLRFRDPATLSMAPRTLHRCEAPSPIVLGSRWRHKQFPNYPLATVEQISAIGDIWLDTDSPGWTGHTPLTFRKTYEPLDGCQQYTAGLAEIQHRHWHLCDEHRTRAVVEELFGKVGESWGSW